MFAEHLTQRFPFRAARNLVRICVRLRPDELDSLEVQLLQPFYEGIQGYGVRFVFTEYEGGTTDRYLYAHELLLLMLRDDCCKKNCILDCAQNYIHYSDCNRTTGVIFLV